MAHGQWSFLHEWVIYDYLLARVGEGTLRLRQVISFGKPLGKQKWVIVEDINPITGTAFPDIQALLLKGFSTKRPAEVKFTTSLFSYHKESKYLKKFNQFTADNGLILVAKHDYCPSGLSEKYKEVDVFEIDIEDFITFCRENFSRLLNRQIKAHTST